jgi:predicted DNA-binding transcriptional regulator AlpA
VESLCRKPRIEIGDQCGFNIGSWHTCGMNEGLRQRYVSPKQAAAYLGLSVFSIYRLIERRAIPFIPLFPSGLRPTHSGRASVRFDVETLDAWMRKQIVKSAAEHVDERTAK